MPQSTGTLLRLARWHESTNDLEAAAAHYAELLRGDPQSVAALLRLGSILHRLGRGEGAVAALSRAVELAPTSAEASGNLAVALAAAGRIDDAVVASGRAAALAPDSALLQRNHGDALMTQGNHAAARESYRRAIVLQPDDPESLNKIACAHRALDEYDAAEASLNKALALAPAFGLALVNMGTLQAVRQNLPRAKSLLQQALAMPALPPDAREEAVAAIDIVDEHRRLQPALNEAVRSANPEALRRAVMATRADLLATDADFIARMHTIAQRLEGAQFSTSDFAGLAATPAWWPALEAHFALHGPEDPEEILGTLRRLRDTPPSAVEAPEAQTGDDVVRFERAVRQRVALGMATRDAAEWETRLRYWHAQIAWHRPEYLPGQFKPMANFTAATPLFRLVAPRAVAGTIRAFRAGPYAAAPAGPCRAALVLAALGECHAFVNANGRVARFLMNAELESVGLRPIVLSRESMARYKAALPALREHADGRAVVDILAAASRQTSALLATVIRAGGWPAGQA